MKTTIQEKASEIQTPNEGWFAATHWTVVLAAGDHASPQHKQAKEQFCQTYWYPVYVFVRAKGHQPEEAEDLTQAFFLRLVEKDVLSGVTREGGRFRSFLLASLKHFLSNERQHQQALKRGGGQTILSIDAATETRYQMDLVDSAPPETSFDRQWATTVLAQVLNRLREEYTRDGKAKAFECLQGCFPGAVGQLSYAEAAQALGMNEEAVRMAAHRLRRRYGQLLRTEVAAHGTSQTEINEEIRYLIAIVNKE